MIRLRPADEADREFFFMLRQEIEPTLERAAHDRWWDGTVEDRFIAFDDALPLCLVGTLRVAVKDGEVSILVAEQERGKGVGRTMLSLLQKQAGGLGYTCLWARVDRTNTASQRAFLSAGYIPTRFEVGL